MADNGGIVAYHGSALQTLYISIDTQVSSMRAAGNTAERIEEEIRAGYIADSSKLFTQAVNNWISDYNALVNLVNQTTADLQAAARLIDQAEQEAGQAPQNWISDDTLAVLTGA